MQPALLAPLRGLPVHGLRVEAKDARVAVASNRSEMLDWMEYYLAGFFSLRRSSLEAHDSDVVVIAERDLFDALEALPARGWIDLPHWSERVEPGFALFARQAASANEPPSYYLQRQGERQTVVVFDPADANGRMTAMRAVRSVLLEQLRQNGWSFLHAAAVARGERCVALTGAKLAGKTTALVQLLRRGYDFLSNDKIATRAHAQEVWAQGFPIAVGVRPGTLACPNLDAAQLLGFASKHHRQSTDVAASDEKRKIRFVPRELAAACGVEVASPRKLAAVIAVEFAATLPRVERRLLTAAEAAIRLDAMKLDRLADICPEHAFLGSTKPRRIEARCASLDVPVYELRHGDDTGAAVSELVREIIGP